MNTYRVELENDDFEIITADTDSEAIGDALADYDVVLNVVLLDDNYDEVKTVF